MYYFLLTDKGEGQRKKTGGKLEDDPAKRKSTGTDLIPPGDADTAATALQDLALVKKSEEQQMTRPVEEQQTTGPAEEQQTTGPAEEQQTSRPAEEQQTTGPETRLKAATKVKEPCEKTASDNNQEEEPLDDNDPGGSVTAIIIY